jgi:ribonuclease D
MPTLIVSAEGLAAVGETLRAEPLIAVDIESNSMYVYRPRVCLIQISTRTADYVIDPIAIDDAPAIAAALAPVLADPAVEKIFHAAEYDVASLKRDFAVQFANLFDTLIAARVCGHKQLGLGALLQHFFAVTSDKQHQTDDWGYRPLSAEGLLYAQMDTHYLPALRDLLIAELTEKGVLDEVRARSCAIAERPAAVHAFDPDGYQRLVRSNRLNRREIGILREVYITRESIAERANLPPMRIISDRALVQIARVAPRRPADLGLVDALTRDQAYRYGPALLEAVMRGERA